MPPFNFFSWEPAIRENLINETDDLCRLLANICGSTQAKRKLIMVAPNSMLLYGSEIRGDVLEIESKRKRLTVVQRTAALRAASAYGTVSVGSRDRR